MRSGGPGSPRASASSSSAASVLPWSASQRACSRASVSAGVARRELHQRALLAALRDAQVDGTAAALREERLEVDRLRARRPARRPRAGSRSRARSTARGSSTSTSSSVASRAASSRKTSRPIILPSRIANSWHRRLVVLAGQPDHVELGPGEGGHLLALHRPLDRPDLVAQLRPRARSPRAATRPPSRLERLDERLLAALEEELDLVDVGAVVVLGDGLDARALAALDVVQQARPLERALAVLDLDRAGPEREEPPDEVHRLVDARRRRVRPEVAAAVVDELAGPLDAREVVGQRDLDVRVALVVLEADVEARLVALDEVGLEEQRLADRCRSSVPRRRRPGR